MGKQRNISLQSNDDAEQYLQLLMRTVIQTKMVELDDGNKYSSVKLNELAMRHYNIWSFNTNATASLLHTLSQ